MEKRFALELLLPVVLVAAATAGLEIFGADLAVARLFFEPGGGWVYGDSEPWVFLYRFGNVPGLSIAVLGAVAAVSGASFRGFPRSRAAGVFLVAFLLIGPGLIVNTGLKDHWGRPRPADIVDFGGAETYRPFWSPGPAAGGRSFPSGHASIGFFVLAPYFVLRRSSPSAARTALAAGIGYGLLMGFGRMVQGGHFLTDVLWSGCLVYGSGWCLSLACERAAGDPPGVRT